MQTTSSSAAQLFLDFKTFLLGRGLTVSKTLADTDLVLANPLGPFLRLKKQEQGEVVSVGFFFGTNADTLALQAVDPELVLPFTLGSGEISESIGNNLSGSVVFCTLTPTSGDSKRYRLSLNLADGLISLEHHDHLNPQYTPNFKLKGGPYMVLGA
jgi:hypothetical protein